MARPPLMIDKLYRNVSNWRDPKDEFNAMFYNISDGKGIQNSGGFRYKSKKGQPTNIENAAFVILITSFAEDEWPDQLDLESGIFTYYGDNRVPGNLLHDTHIGGNRLLDHVFENIHGGIRNIIPPFFCFQKVKKEGSYMKFLGLAAPGAKGLSSLDDLTAVWRVQEGRRFQNYKAFLTILKEDILYWDWLDDLVEGVLPGESIYCPTSWKQWVCDGAYNVLECQTKKTPRQKNEQLAQSEIEKKVIEILLSLTDREFEFASKDILKFLDSRFTKLEVTPRIRDGGRDIIGFYKIGHDLHEVLLNVYVEAKRWRSGGVGVKPMSRLISRLKHRDLGVFVTTSYFNKQVQQELIDDKQPIILISGGDIAKIIISKEIFGKGNEQKILDWIRSVKYDAST